ncbi:MAG: hypothetical protein GF418_01225 [Chitinivibrionales bacterium]|nr:hypothetical protein [Chitinivibrionales bacterium]MBD3394223.1 hypothetical protein [Chitinivibrionales bacterium]
MRFFAAMLAGFVLMPCAHAAKTVVFKAGRNLQEAIEREGEGTTFLFEAGTYHGLQVNPHDGQQFIGENGTVWNGNGQRYAIGGAVGNVVIRNIEFTGYNAPAQHGVINSYPGGDGATHGAHHWTIEDCEIHHNGGGGIAIGNNFVVRNCHVHHQNQIGLIYGGNGSLVEGCEVSYCNYNAAYDWGWEGGGSKFKKANDLIIRNCYVHDNHGPGLWADFCGSNIIYEGNILENNYAMGIEHEISHDATIRCNVAYGNSHGVTGTEWLYGSQIFLSTSDNVEVYYNVVRASVGETNGITMCNQPRGGNYYCRNNCVHDNDITHTVAGGHNGADSDYDQSTFWSTGNNRFDHNTYHVVDLDAKYFRWNDPGGSGWSRWLTWQEFRDMGQEQNGQFDDNIDLSLPSFWGECQDLFTYFASGYEGVHMQQNVATASPRDRMELRAQVVKSAELAIRVPQGYHTIQILDARGRKAAQCRLGDCTAASISSRELTGSGVYLVRALGPAGTRQTTVMVP